MEYVWYWAESDELLVLPVKPDPGNENKIHTMVIAGEDVDTCLIYVGEL